MCPSYYHPTLADWSPISDSDNTSEDPDYVPPGKVNPRVSSGRGPAVGCKVVDYMYLVSESEDGPINLVTDGEKSEDTEDSDGGKDGNRGNETGSSEQWEDAIDK